MDGEPEADEEPKVELKPRLDEPKVDDDVGLEQG